MILLYLLRWVYPLTRFRIDDLDNLTIHPKKAFIIGALDKEIRLSFAQRIKGTLPEPYQELISEAKEKDTPDFKYAKDGKSPSDPLGAFWWEMELKD